jgi:ABC-type bacteriocin/lantibiotic exporter with double-glycine peptidase domain
MVCSASESITGLRTVRAFANENDRISAYVANVQRSYELGVKVSVAGDLSLSIQSDIYIV